MAIRLKLSNVRLAFAHDLFTAKEQGDGDDKRMVFGCTLLFDLKHPQLPEVNAAIEKSFQEKFGAKAALTLKAAKATEKAGLRDGDLKSYAGYPGSLYLGCSNAVRPLTLAKDKSPVTASDGVLYSGCYVNAIVDIKAYDHPKGGKGISTAIAGVQFLADGENTGGGGSHADADDFDDVSEGATADDLA